MTNKKSKDTKLKLIMFNNKRKTIWKEEALLKEIVDNLILSVEMVLDAIEETDKNSIWTEEEKKQCYIEIMDALEYSVDCSMGGRAAFMVGMDLKPSEFYFMKEGEK